ncbi:hypothetical protein GCM10022222_17600 [Amycolatopsis ultiminotia]|uniref:Uncharacterized protein n=1 Tax=Amycolatopsis ultiminotia TaxID=543629 RepID=A0ABP6VEW0_9PSEU
MAGAVAVFVTTNSAGAAALVAAGTVLIALALFANQLESVEGGGFKLQLGAVAAKLREADEAEEAGDAEGAGQLRQEARLLFAAMEPIANQYEAIRESSPYGRDRTHAMGDLVEQAKKMAEFDFVSTEAVEELFRSGQDGNRITALGLMQANPELASVPLLTETIRRPRSSFEQWHALRISLEVVRRGSATAQHEDIRQAIALARANGTLGTRRDQSRVRLAQRIANAMEQDGDRRTE